MNFHFSKTLLIFLAINSLCKCSLNVISPSDLTTQFPNSQINYSVTHYGTIPYGRKFQGIVRSAPIADACLNMNSFDENISQQTLFLLIEQGNCNFVTKSRNAQRIGANLAIIIVIIYQFCKPYII